jgi:phospholipase/lecithinase/hemolysin
MFIRILHETHDGCQQTSMALYDAWSFMSDVLDNPKEFGFMNNTCIGNECVWWDDYHPRSAFHQLLAADIERYIQLEFGAAIVQE